MNSNPCSLWLFDPASYFWYWWSMNSSVWRALMDLSKSCICICALQISGFAGLPALHLSNPAACICRQVISTLLLEQRWISPKTISVFLKSNHLHFQTGDIHICCFLHCSSSEFTRPAYFHSSLPTEWWIDHTSPRTNSIQSVLTNQFFLKSFLVHNFG